MEDLFFAIRCVNDPELFWNNKWGWFDFEDGMETFTKNQITQVHLPIEGEWIDYYTLKPI